MDYKRLRLAAGYTAKEAAAKLLITPQHLRAIERGVKHPSPLLTLRMKYLYGRSYET